MIMTEIFSYAFLSRAFLSGLLVSAAAALLGVSLVLRRYSMIGDGLSHVGFGALALATVLSLSPMAVTIPVVVLTAFLLLRLPEKAKGSGDSAIALISSSALALGVLAVSLGGVNTDLNSFLFGSIVSVSKSDAAVSAVVSVVTIAVYLVFYHQLYAATFDPAFARATGIKCERYTTLLAVLTALVIVIGMRLLGSLLISSLIIFPAMTAMRVAKTYFSVTVLAVVESLLAFVLGFVASYAFSLPTGATIVVSHLILFLIVLITGKAVSLVNKRRA